MKCKCEKCDTIFEAKGSKTFMVLTGGTECPNCGGNVCIVLAHRKKNLRRKT